MSKKNTRRSPDPERNLKLRAIYCDFDTIERWIWYLRNANPTPLPGEPAFFREPHIAALREAIGQQQSRLDSTAAQHQGELSWSAHAADCDSRFHAAMEWISRRDPVIAEAYRYDSALFQQQAASWPAHGLALVHSRD
jgi:hypothetical protein